MNAEAVPLKHLAQLNPETLSETTDPNHSFRYVDIAAVGRGVLVEEPEAMIFDTSPSRARRVLRTGDTIISTVRTYLRAVWTFRDAEADLVASTGFVCLRPRPDTDPRFLGWLAQADTVIEEVVAASVGVSYPAVNPSDVGDIRVPCPSLPSQRAVADYLDDETARIDAVIAAKENMLALLTEREGSLIHELTSRGLRGLPTVDSGVQWLGAIPEHWRAMQIRRVGQVRRGASPRPIDDPVYFDEDGEYAWVRIADVTDSDRYLTTTTQRLSNLGSSLSAKLVPGSLFISIAGSVGKPMITKIKCCVHDGFVYFERLRVRPDYLYYLFKGSQLFRGLGKLGTQLNLNTETVGSIVIPVPPLDEQDEIVAELDRRLARASSLRTAHLSHLELLRERRQALITAAVTGQLAIPGAL